jgi:hypothetical protein
MSHTVTPVRQGPAARYGDTQAVNDIHALLTAPGGLTSEEVTAAVADIIARTGRSLARARMILAEVAEDTYGMPVARVDADGTVVLVSQDPDGPGVLIQVATGDAAEAAGLVITIDGRPVSRSPARARASRPKPARHPSAADRGGQPSATPEGEGDRS